MTGKSNASDNRRSPMTLARLTISASLIFAMVACGSTPERATLTNIGSNDISIESAFSPDGSADVLVYKIIDSANSTLRLAAYSFTSPGVVSRLIAAKRRGVDVQVIVDERGNMGRANTAALNLIVNAGIPTRTISAYAIHHDKYIIADQKDVQTGSFNYSKAAAKSNSENVVVIWNDVQLAKAFIGHWESRWQAGHPYVAKNY
ncbi:MAG: phospholipase D family protein [Pseudomonadota bacterium]